MFRDGLLLYKGRPVIPRRLHTQLVNYYHYKDPGMKHAGITKTIMAIRKDFFVEGLQQRVTSVVADCNRCNRNKYLKWKHYGTLPVTCEVGETLHMDLFGVRALKPARGYNAVLVVVERLSGFTILIELKKKTSDNILKALQARVFPYIGLLRILTTDNEPSFLSNEVKK